MSRDCRRWVETNGHGESEKTLLSFNWEVNHLIRESEHFIFNGIKSDTYGILNVNMGSGLLEEPFSGRRQITKQRVRGNPISYIIDYEEDPLTFSVSFAFRDKYDEDKIREVARWLLIKKVAPLQFSENLDRIFYGSFVGDSKLVHNAMHQGYIQLDFECSSPYAYTPVFQSQIFNYSLSDSSGTLVDFGNITSIETRIKLKLANGSKLGDGVRARLYINTGREIIETDQIAINESDFTFVNLLLDKRISFIKSMGIKVNSLENSEGSATIYVDKIQCVDSSDPLDEEGKVVKKDLFAFQSNVQDWKIDLSRNTSGASGLDIDTEGKVLNVNFNLGEGEFYIHHIYPIGSEYVFENVGDLPTKPILTVEIVDGNSFSIINKSNGGQNITFSGLAKNETLTIDCEAEIIESDIPATYRYGNMTNDSDFLQMVFGKNYLTIKGNVKIQWKWQSPLLQG